MTPESIDQSDIPEHDEHELDALLDFLHRERGFDFSGYKRSSLTRRVHRRMASVGVSSLAEYFGFIERSAGELTELFNVLLINVTAFFRDRAAWEALALLLPTFLDADADTPIRVWSAGCSSGEEPYTLAIVLREALGEEAFLRRVKIYATDIDEDALAVARLATYSGETLEDVPPSLVEKYFVPSGDRFMVAKELRRDVIFGRHDLLRDAPIPQVDVLCCRNLLMYFNPTTQERVLENLRYALRPGGVLLLGRAEMLLSHSRLFTPVELKLRLFTPARRDSHPPRSGDLEEDATHRLRHELRRANLDLETTQDELERAQREIDGTHVLLQSMNEELETTNEELRSANEELEAMNEELQSTNEELQTINEELRQRGTELNATSALFAAVLTSLQDAVAVLDRELRVQVWNARMVELTGVRAPDALGRHLPTLAAAFESTLPLTTLQMKDGRNIATSLRAALEPPPPPNAGAGAEESVGTIDGTDRYGDKITFEVRVAPLQGGASGVIVLVGEVG